jgi:hypothetical protein
MKERLTYIIKDPVQGYDPSNLEIEKTSIFVKEIQGARERHLTFDLDELPDGVRSLTDDAVL